MSELFGAAFVVFSIFGLIWFFNDYMETLFFYIALGVGIAGLYGAYITGDWWRIPTSVLSFFVFFAIGQQLTGAFDGGGKSYGDGGGDDGGN